MAWQQPCRDWREAIPAAANKGCGWPPPESVVESEVFGETLLRVVDLAYEALSVDGEEVRQSPHQVEQGDGVCVLGADVVILGVSVVVDARMDRHEREARRVESLPEKAESGELRMLRQDEGRQG